MRGEVFSFRHHLIHADAFLDQLFQRAHFNVKFEFAAFDGGDIQEVAQKGQHVIAHFMNGLKEFFFGIFRQGFSVIQQDF